MAEGAVLASLGWLVSPLMNKLFNKAYDHLGTGIEERMTILEATVLARLSLAIEKAEKSPNKEKLVHWLNRLKRAYYEVEDAIDLFEYELLKQKVKDDRKTLEQKEKSKRGTRISLPSQIVLKKFKDSFSVLSQKKIKLKDCINKLVEIAKEANEFRDLLEAQENGSGSDADRETISENPSRVFGRERAKEIIVRLLLTKKPLNSWPSILIVIKNMIEFIVGLLMKKSFNSDPGPSTRPAIPIIAIMGRSGVGKTALAQYVYKHMDEQNHFDIPVWVHTRRKFKASDVIQNMIEIIKKKERASNDYPSTSIEALFTEIRLMLGSKKLLLVLDDFWSDTEDFVTQWESFIGCISSCLPGSRILLTTQSKNTSAQAHLAGVTHVLTYHLEEIESRQFLDLFMYHTRLSNCHLQKEEFKKIGHKIAEKLKGDPGAAKLVGQQLSQKLDLRHWEEVAEKDWLGDKNNMKARIWSYQQLPQNLQRCFAICSLFPKGTIFRRELLINLWMAEGFIRPSDKEERLEDISENYLHELVSRFFLEEVVFKGEKHYEIHDLLQDLAERVQGDDFIRIDPPNSREDPSHISDKLSRCENIRHIYIPSSMISKLKEELCRMKNICTFCVENDGSLISKKVLQEILRHLEKLRVLYLPECGDELPDSVGNLKHLRFLRSYGSRSLKKLPDSICKLYHLQTLHLPNCQSLPKDICELISLRRFYTAGQTRSHISHVGRLMSLQGIDQFVVRKEPGYELHQLENLNQLRSEMSITDLQNVVSLEDAVKANMEKKIHLEELEFKWNLVESSTSNPTGLSSQHVELLDALQPHPRISGLKVDGFGGNRFPNWLFSQNSLKYLRSLILIDCNMVEEISSIHESLPSCTRLILRHFKNLKKMPTFPPNLTSLEINHITKPSYFSEDDLLKKEERNQSKLEVVKQIAECLKPKVELSYVNFKSHVHLFILFVKHRLQAAFDESSDPLSNVWRDRLKFHPRNEDYSWVELWDVWNMFMQCHMDTMFNKKQESKLVLPSSLVYLEISSCRITDDALSTCIQCLVSLSKLELSDIMTITSLPPQEVLCSLKNLLSLTIRGCYMLSSLGGIVALTSLKELELEYCPNLNISNDSLPSTLEKLNIFYCSAAPTIHALNVSHVICALDVGNLSLLKELVLMGWYGHLKGLNSLTALHSLWVVHCPSIRPLFPMDKCTASLHVVLVGNLKLLKLILSNETISSLEVLGINWLQGDSSDDEIFQSLTSLKDLSFFSCGNTQLPKNLKNLASLSYIGLDNCPNLCELELEDLPINLHELRFKDCPALTEKFNKGGPCGPYRVMFHAGSTFVTFPSKCKLIWQPHEEINRF